MPIIETSSGEKLIVFQGESRRTELICDEALQDALRGEHGDYAPFKEFLRRMRRLRLSQT
ncbi:MAG: hypothetical protein ABIH38_01930 [Patescibacteria group bacterium]